MSSCESLNNEEVDAKAINNLEDALISLSINAKEFYLGKSVPEFEEAPESPLSFYRDWVSTNRPVIFRNAITNWPAFTKWQDLMYFRQKIGESRVTVSMTPNGYADAIVCDATTCRFVMPYEEEMSMNAFIDILEQPSIHNGVHYIQKQNSNLTDEFRVLQEDIIELPWSREAFGKPPDAINFWMGDHEAVTSTHKDPYENIYCVVKGYKDIILFPPTDLPWLKYKICSQAKYEKTSSNDFVIKDLPETPNIPWIIVDPLNPDYDLYPEYQNATPYKLRLNAGDVLYLPSLWFHHLRQSHGCVAVNFWYDMDFDVKWNYFQFLSNVAKLNNA